MTLEKLAFWHREQAERFEYLAKNHKTTGATVHLNAVTRRNEVQAAFHREAHDAIRAALKL